MPKLASSLLGFLPLYENVLYPLSPEVRGVRVNNGNFEDLTGLTIANLIKAIEMRHVIPYFTKTTKNII